MEMDKIFKEESLEAAVEAVGASMVASYPEVTSGDMGPMDAIPFEDALRGFIKTWLYWNHPDSDAKYEWGIPLDMKEMLSTIRTPLNEIEQFLESEAQQPLTEAYRIKMVAYHKQLLGLVDAG